MTEDPYERPAPTSSLSPRSLRPKRSIFTLRPFARTEQPPPDIEIIGAPAGAVAPATPRRWPWLAGALVLALGVGGAAWAAKRKPPGVRAPMLLVNGSPQTKQTPSGATERWGKNEITITIDQSFAALGPSAPSAVQQAFGTWLSSGAPLPPLRFDSGSGLSAKVEPDGVNAVVYAPIDIPGHKHAIAVTVGFADPGTGRIVEADLIVNSTLEIAVLEGAAPEEACAGRYDLQNVVTHEAGHFFGLDEDHSDGEATMYFKTGKCELKKRDLGPSDSSVMTALYSGAAPPEPEADDPGGGCGGATTSPVPPAAGAWAFVAVLLAAAARRKSG